MKPILIVDDDARTRRVLEILTRRMGLRPRSFESAVDALDCLRSERFALILTDLKMPGMGGLEFMRALRRLDDDVPVIVLTAYGTVESAVEAMKLGALDFVSKPLDAEVLEPLVERALENARRRTENRYWRETQVGAAAGTIDEIVGESTSMNRVFDVVRKVAPTNSSVLITGETGTGKELVARSIHRLSDRASKLFVPLNCSAIPAELLESELFGHVKGAFSGAHSDRIGKFEASDGGTIFLDEIGDMELRLQAKLLRVLQEGIVEPVGANRRIHVDVRVVSSTNRELEQDIESGRFRSDLFYRLNVVRIELPALRDRDSDVTRLATHFLREFENEFGNGPLEFTPAALSAFGAYRWPGNVRELRNVIERAVVLSDGDEIGLELLALPDDDFQPNQAAPRGEESDRLAEVVASAERAAILNALRASHDNKGLAAERLGIGERTLWTKLKKHGLLSSDRATLPED